MKWAILTAISVFITWCCGAMLEWDTHGNLIAHSYSIWGDWSAHFTFISNLLNRGIGWLSSDNPIFFGTPFQYPFLSHLITAGIALVTPLSMIRATFVSSMLLLFLFPFMLHRFFKSVGLTDRQSIFSILTFLFIGGLQIFDSSLDPQQPLTNQFQAGSVVTQFTLFEFFPQRAFLFGIILLLSSISFGVSRIRLGTFRKKHFFILSIAFSLLAWTHLHSWIAAGCLLLLFFVFSFFAKLSPSSEISGTPTPSSISISETRSLFSGPRPIFFFGASVLVMSIPLLYFLLARAPSSMSWQWWFPGWARNASAGLSGAQSMNFFSFWIYNTGFLLPLVIGGSILLIKTLKKDGKKLLDSPIILLASAGTVLFIVCELICLQPYFYDNLKLFTYAFLFLAPLAGIALDGFFRKKALIPVALIVLAIQISTAVQDHLYFAKGHQTAPFFTAEEFRLVDKFKTMRRSSDAWVAIAPKHNHWIPALAGNPVWMGYPGWLWSWGISYQERERELNEILRGEGRALDLLRSSPIEYVVLNDGDLVDRTPANVTFFRQHFPVLFEEGAWHVFSVR